LEEEEGGDGSVVVVVVVLAMVVIFDAVVANVEGVLLEEVGNGFDSVLLLQALDEVEEGGAHHDVYVHVVDELNVVQVWEQGDVVENESLESLETHFGTGKIFLLHISFLRINQVNILVKQSFVSFQCRIGDDHNWPIKHSLATDAHNSLFQQRT